MIFYLSKKGEIVEMKELKGKYATAKIFTDLVDEKSIEQVKTLLDQEFVAGSKIRMMPDIHAGAGCTIGTTMTVGDKICPNLVGVDIGCGMLVVKLSSLCNMDLEKLDRVIRKYIPTGFNVRDEVHPYILNTRIGELDCYKAIDLVERARRSVGTLGGGNHFIEIDRDEEGYYYLVIHTGSRNLGVEVASYYQDWAYESMRQAYKNNRDFAIKALKENGMEREIQQVLKNLEDTKPVKELCSVGGLFFDSYIHDMKIVQEYAKWNRLAIANEILLHMEWNELFSFETVHNYIDTKYMILRKGAVSAKDGELLLIPITMRDGSLICRGKGNPDWNYSAPHGAGRLYGRMEAKRRFSVEEYRESMDGIFTTSVGDDTLDECPMAYKPMEAIVDNIGDTVDILKVIKPAYNFKSPS